MLGIKGKSKNYYKKPPSGRRRFSFQNLGLILKIFFLLSLLAGISIFIIFGYDLIVQWNYFNAKTISVNGNVQLADEQIVEYAQLHAGENILSMNLSAAKKRLIMHPIIAEADIRRNFPSGITVKVKEHQPIAILDLGRTFAINYSGEIFIEISSSGLKNIPVIAGFRPSDIDSNGEIKGMPFDDVMKILHLGLKPDCILPTGIIKRIEVDKQTGLTLNLSGRIKKIKLGYGDYPKKYESLKMIFTFLNERPDLKNFIFIDVNNLNRIVLKPSQI